MTYVALGLKEKQNVYHTLTLVLPQGAVEKATPNRFRSAVPGAHVWGCGALAELSQQPLRFLLR